MQVRLPTAASSVVGIPELPVCFRGTHSNPASVYHRSTRLDVAVSFGYRRGPRCMAEWCRRMGCLASPCRRQPSPKKTPSPQFLCAVPHREGTRSIACRLGAGAVHHARELDITSAPVLPPVILKGYTLAPVLVTTPGLLLLPGATVKPPCRRP